MLDPASCPDGNFPLGIPGFRYGDLYAPERLAELTAAFYAEATMTVPAVMREFRRWQSDPAELSPPEQSEIVLGLAPVLSEFIGRLFAVQEELAHHAEIAHGDDVVFWWKREVITRRIIKNRRDTELGSLEPDDVTRRVRAVIRATLGSEARPDDLEWNLASAARITDRLQESQKTGGDDVDLARIAAALRNDADGATLAAEGPACWFEEIRTWARLALSHPAVAAQVKGWVSFRFPHKVDFAHLVHLRRPDPGAPHVITAPEGGTRPRDGFKLTDHRMSRRQVLGETDYCIFCHPREKDSCSRGIVEKDGSLKKNPLGISVTGCPLHERISEAHQLKADGDPLAALAVIMVDNPMVPGTGHRICNDCMKGCIFQNQDPVDIPQAETGALTDVLGLSWGPEIYLLLTRWNPLDPRRPHTRPYHGHNVMVVGLGPAGYTLAHHLAQEGFGVAGIDGLKLEPFPDGLVGTASRLPRPIRSWDELWLECDQRPLAGFGGVSEYGITVRWDKNFLTLIQLSLLRRTTFRCWGGVRFGGTVTLDDAWNLGFHHVAIAAGAGRPTLVDIENNLAPGIRKASDFLMALQLTGAGRKESVANLQVRLPAIVIGGGLTGIDTATEILAYYPIQVEKTLDRHEALVSEGGEDTVRRGLGVVDQQILDEFLAHGQEVRQERIRAGGEGRIPNFLPLLDRWGGVHLAYRRSLQESPAYRLNHEEVHHALAEGIRFAEGLNPKRAILDEHGWVAAMEFEGADGTRHTLAARTVCIAAGTAPNVIYEKEHPGTFELDARRSFFRMHVREGDGIRPAQAGEVGFFTSQDGGPHRRVTFYGDNHPTYAGSVVKAMASAKDGHHHVVSLFGEAVAAQDPGEQPGRDAAWLETVDRLDQEWSAQVVAVAELTPTIIEVIVRAPAAARHFEPGQFYRVHDFEADAAVVDGTRLLMEGLALTGAWVDKEQGLLSFIALEMGGSSRMLRRLRPGQRVVVMGPTGAPTHITQETVALVGGGLGNAVLFSIGRAFRTQGARVLYFAGYRNPEDVYKIDEIEAAADQIVWCCDREPAPLARRPQDRSFVGNIVAAMRAYVAGDLGVPQIPGESWDRLIVIGSDRMMAAVKGARHGVLAPWLLRCKTAIGSINSPMQCMMKEVCAQCLQKHRDPVTGKESFVFTCFDQDQELDRVDFAHLADRLRQNRVQEHVTDLWVRRVSRIQATR